MTWLTGLTGLLLLALALTLGVMGMAAFGARRWAADTDALHRKLDAARLDDKAQAPSPTRYSVRELEGLPAPVQRYFRAVLQDGQALIAAATLTLEGRFNMSATGHQWKPFESRQHVVTLRPGFIWDARVTLFPGLVVRVIDSYIAGQGLLRAALLGLFTVADQRGGGEIARGEFMRFFAEAAWVPTALLPSQGVRWEAVDAHSAHATMTDGELTLTLLFSFNKDGLIESARAKARGATVGKETLMLPWEGRWSDYRPHDGMRVPMKGEAAWLHPQERRPYFVGSVTSLSYQFMP